MSETTPPDDGAVHLKIAGDIATLTFDRPQARNAMTWAMYEQLAAHARQLASDRSIRVAILDSVSDQAFVAGTDIAQFLAFRDGEDGVRYEQQIDQIVTVLEQVPCPTIARLEGWTVGGGLAIATACDFRIASGSARFAVPIARTLGNTLSARSLARLRAAWGLQPVRRMLLAAEALDAPTALACGFLHQLADGPALDAAVQALADRVRVLAPVTQHTVKETLRRLVSDDVDEMNELISRCYGSDDFHEGVQAFTGKRAPVWRGR